MSSRNSVPASLGLSLSLASTLALGCTADEARKDAEYRYGQLTELADK